MVDDILEGGGAVVMKVRRGVRQTAQLRHVELVPVIPGRRRTANDTS